MSMLTNDNLISYNPLKYCEIRSVGLYLIVSFVSGNDGGRAGQLRGDGERRARADGGGGSGCTHICDQFHAARSAPAHRRAAVQRGPRAWYLSNFFFIAHPELA